MSRPLEGLAGTIDTQNEIINLQSRVIEELFTLLMQYISAEEADRLSCVQTINEAAKLRAGLEGGLAK